MASAEDQRADVFQFPLLSRHDLPLGDVADAVVTVEDTGADVRRDLLVIRFANPLGKLSAHAAASEHATLAAASALAASDPGSENVTPFRAPHASM